MKCKSIELVDFPLSIAGIIRGTGPLLENAAAFTAIAYHNIPLGLTPAQ